MDIESHQEYISETFTNVVSVEVELVQTEFDDCQFVECDFSGSLFRDCTFTDCSFSRCNLSLLRALSSQFKDVSFEDCKLTGIDWTVAAWPRFAFNASITFRECMMNDSSFFGLKLDELIMTNCKAHDVDFREGSFNDADFSQTDFRGALFGNTSLKKAVFVDAVEYNIDVSSNNITQAKFSCYEALNLLRSMNIVLVD